MTWKWSIGIGILLMTVGILFLLFPMTGSIFLEQLLAGAVLLAGIFHMLVFIRSKNRLEKVFNGIFSSLNILFGTALLFLPFVGALSTARLLIGLFALDGTCRLFFYQRLKGGIRPIMTMVGGLVSLTLAALLIISWPIFTYWPIGLSLAFYFLFSGLSFYWGGLAKKDQVTGESVDPSKRSGPRSNKVA